MNNFPPQANYPSRRETVAEDENDQAAANPDHQLEIAPLAQHLQYIYRETLFTCEDMADDHPGRERLVLDFEAMQRDRGRYRPLFHPPQLGDYHIPLPMLIRRLCHLRRYEYAARYGQYMAAFGVRVEQPEDFTRLPYWDLEWASLHALLKTERPLWEAWKRRDLTVALQNIPHTRAIYKCCTYMGLNYDNFLQCLEDHLDPESIVHEPWHMYCVEGEWTDFARVLVQDLRDLPVVFPIEQQGDIPALQAIIQLIMVQYFKVNMAEPQDYKSWVPREDFDPAVATVLERIRDPEVALNSQFPITVAQDASRLFDMCNRYITDGSPVEQEEKIWRLRRGAWVTMIKGHIRAREGDSRYRDRAGEVWSFLNLHSWVRFN